MTGLRWLDPVVVVAYMVGVTLVGVWFSRKQTSTEEYFVAGRSVPSWAMGLSLLATLISSVTFVAYPGSSYGGDWSQLVPGFMALAVVAIGGMVIIPFYRHAVGMSTYEYFERRFGRPTRIYASLAFLLAHFAKMAFVYYLMALTINSIMGWPVTYVIVISAAVTIFYSLIGGFEAIIWTDVIQVFVCWIGVAFTLYYLLAFPGGGSAVLQLAWDNNKFSLGNPEMTLSKPTILVLGIYGVFWFLQRYTADQTIVQRYLVAKTDRSAMKGVALGAVMTIPVWTVFMLLGTCTWGYYKITQEALPAYITKADQVFPHFVATHLPPGIAGLFLASLLGAAMTMLASDLNSIAVVGVEDYYRTWRPNSTDRQRLMMGKSLVMIAGLISAAGGFVLSFSTGPALTLYFLSNAIFSSALAGLFFLAFFSSRANRQGVYIGIWASSICTLWAVLTKGAKPIWDLAPYNFKWDDLMIGAVGNVVLIVFGYLASLAFSAWTGSQRDPNAVTVWHWLARRNRHTAQVATGARGAD